MSPIETKRQRTAARLLIAGFLLFAMVVFAAPGLSFSGVPVALQTTSSPSGSARPSGSATPSGSASPSRSASPSSSATPGGSASPAPTGPAIQFLNPSSHSRIVSNKNDGTNATYHLVAVTREVPADPIVEFKYQQGTGNEVSIGIASRVGTSDTFELEWNLGGLPDGSYTLKAIVYGGSTEFARDEQTVTVNNADSLTDPTAETVEITAPRNGSPAGFFQPSGSKVAHTVVDVTSSGAIAPPSTSSGTATVGVSYTKTPIGTEPVWISCGSGTRASTGINNIRCTLKEGDAPADVTGLAAVANSSAAQVVGGSGDAHRVFPYSQAPTTISLEPREQTKPAAACADVVTATLLDQNGNKIAGANVDVHGKGPSDNLQFDDSGNNSSAHQGPDKAHSGPESARDCEGSANGGTQGQHEFAPGNPDTKHIETVTAGTSDLGQFKFQLFSPDQGSTAFAVWADTDDDDQWCAEETSSRGSVTWIQSASASPSPSGSSSASPTPSGSGSPRPSGSPSGSASASPSTSSTARPEPTTLEPDIQSCPKPTGSASPSTSPGVANRAVSLDASKRRVTFGGRVALRGRVNSADASCVDNEVIEIRRRVYGTTEFKDFRTTATDDDGNFKVVTKPGKSADYEAIAPQQGQCDEAMSSSAPVQVKVQIAVGSDRVGDRVSFLGRVRPNHRKTDVVLQRKKGTKWVVVDEDGLNTRSRYSFAIDVDWNGKRVFRVKWKTQDEEHTSGTSRKVVVRAT